MFYIGLIFLTLGVLWFMATLYILCIPQEERAEDHLSPAGGHIPQEKGALFRHIGFAMFLSAMMMVSLLMKGTDWLIRLFKKAEGK